MGELKEILISGHFSWVAGVWLWDQFIATRMYTSGSHFEGVPGLTPGTFGESINKIIQIVHCKAQVVSIYAVEKKKIKSEKRLINGQMKVILANMGELIE